MSGKASLRVVTLNMWGAEEPLAARMKLIEEGLRALEPDVVALQEVREVPETLPNQGEMLADALGCNCAYVPATPFGGGHEGVAILSRHPIVEQSAIELPHARPEERRVLLSVKIAHDAAPAWIHTTHLNYRLHHGKEREDQIVAIDDEVAARKAGTDAPQILLGDLNARPDSDEIRYLCGLTTLAGRRTFYQDAWAVMHGTEPGYTWAKANPYTGRLAFLMPDRRLDYVFVTPPRRDGRGRILRCQIVLAEPDSAGIYPSDHFGLLADVQLIPDAV